MHLYTDTYMHIHMYIFYFHVCMLFLCMYVNTHIYIYICACMHICMYMHIYICDMYTHTLINTYTRARAARICTPTHDKVFSTFPFSIFPTILPSNAQAAWIEFIFSLNPRLFMFGRQNTMYICM